MSTHITFDNFHCQKCCSRTDLISSEKARAIGLRHTYELAVDSKKFGIDLTSKHMVEFYSQLYGEIEAALERGSNVVESEIPLIAYVRRKLELQYMQIFLLSKRERLTNGTPDGSMLYTYQVEFVGLD